ncbi:hypothetical protein ACS0H5_000711 [Campylobacter lari]
MRKINVVCFGSCDMYPTYGFVGGIKDVGSKVVSFGESFNGVHSVLYHLLRKENQNIINNADLFVVGITETTKETAYSDMEMYEIFYKKLSNIGKKVVVIIMPHATTDNDFYGNFHQNRCEIFGFNLIDIKCFCIENKIYEFYTKYYDSRHPFYSFMSGISKRIITNYEKLQYPKKNNQIDNYIFEIYPVKDFISEDIFQLKKARTFTTYENIIEIPLGKKIKFPLCCIGKKLIGIHMFNGFIGVKDVSKFSIANKNQKFLLQTPPYNRVVQINEHFIVDDESYICAYVNDDAKITYPSYRYTQLKETNLGIVAFFLSENNKISFDFQNSQDFKLSQEYNFAYLLNFLIEGKKFIEDYNKKQDIVRIKPLQDQIAILINEKQNLQNQIMQFQKITNSLPMEKQQFEISNTDQNSTKTRIQNQLSYKLGQAMIVNSKSILGYIRMPFVLSYIYDKHKQEQKIYQEKIKQDPSLKLPSLEDYPDYKEALKEKECLTYKLGQALIKANKTWYGGGYIKLLFEVRKLKREFKSKKI